MIRSRTFISALALAILAAGLAATPATASEGSPDASAASASFERQREEAALRVGADPDLSSTASNRSTTARDREVLLDFSRPARTKEWLDAYSRMLVGSSLEGTMDILRTFEERRTVSEGDPEVQEDGTTIWRELVRDQDVDGDGLTDVIILRFTEKNWDLLDASLVAQSGLDGSTLWSRSIWTPGEPALTFLVPLGDMDADLIDDFAVVDVILQEIVVSSCIPVVGCAGDRERELRVTLISGADGATVWTQGFHREGYSRTGPLGSEFSIPIWAATITQLARAGSEQLAISLVQLDVKTEIIGGSPLPVSSVRRTYSAKLEGVLLHGADGSIQGLLSEESQEQVATFSRAGDTVGDASEDLFLRPAFALPAPSWTVCVAASCPIAESTTSSLVARMIDGWELLEAWSLPIGTTSLADPLNATFEDMNGDGRDDLLLKTGYLEEFDDHWFEEVFTDLDLISGVDGAKVWRRSLGSYASWFPAGLGDIGGSPGSDMLIVEYPGPRVVRVDGGTGQELLATQPLQPDDGWWMFFPGDMSGDGHGDIAMQIYTLADEITFRVEDGVSGATVFEDGFDWSNDLAPVSDLNGDGTIDLLGSSVAWLRTGRNVTLAAISMPSGATLAESEYREGRDHYSWISATADADGDGGGDLFVLTAYFPEDWMYRTQVTLRRGSSLDQIWRSGDELPPIPDEGTGQISVRILDSNGDPLPDACATPVPTDWDTYASVSDESGEAVMGQLPEGDYAVRVSDCGAGDHLQTWYGGATMSFDAAQVHLDDGQSLHLGDIQLESAPPPINDAAADAIVVDALPFEDGRSLTGATEQDVDCDDDSVWYSFTPSEDTDVLATVEGDSWLSVSVFEPDSLAGDACYWYTQTRFGSSFEFGAPAGETTLIRIGGYEGSFRLKLEPTSIARIHGTVTDSSGEPLEGICVDSYFEYFDFWFRDGQAVTDAAGQYRLIPSYGSPSKINFRSCGPGGHVAEWFDDVPMFEQATGIDLDAGSVQADAQLDDPIPSGENDTFLEAERVALPASIRTSNWFAASESFFDAGCPVNRSLWYRFIAPANGRVTVDTRGSNFDTMLGAYLVAPPFTELDCNDDTFDRNAYLDIEVKAGLEYVVQAGSWGLEAGALSLAFAFEPSAAPGGAALQRMAPAVAMSRL